MTDKHTQIWREPLTDSERSIIKATIAALDSRFGDDRAAKKWMNFMLARIDAAEAHIRELQNEIDPPSYDPILDAKPNWPE